MAPYSYLPHRVSIEEERRLAYVGLTRAQKILTLSYARIRKRFGERIECEVSRFIDELPQDDIVWEGGKDTAGKKNAVRHIWQI